MMLGFIADLSTNASLLLLLCLFAVCVFEFINGFHDTANAVATVIYTKTLPPVFAVIWSGGWNFLGAMFGGIAVAMGILKLMPLSDMMATSLNENIALVLSILLTAIVWNLGTWYFGIPCSSSHTLIGALLGGGFAFFTIHAGASPNWDKAKDIGMSLLISPIFGFALAIGLMYFLRVMVKSKTIFKSPDETKKAPPLWIRGILITTCTLVSFFHGNNDGQKGVGLLLVVMMAFMPVHFALSPDFSAAGAKMHVEKISTALEQAVALDSTHLVLNSPLALACRNIGVQLDSFNAGDSKAVFAMRKGIQDLNKKLDVSIKGEVIKGAPAQAIIQEQKALKGFYEFRVAWAVLLISLCLGIGTMVSGDVTSVA